MAEISLKIKSDFEKAAADFKSLGATSDSFQKSIQKTQAALEKEGNSIGELSNKAKVNAMAITAVKGADAGLRAELAALQREMQNLIKRGLDPMSPALDKMKNRMGEIQGQLPKTNTAFSGLASNIAMVSGMIAGSAIATKLIDIGKSSLYAASAAQENQIAFKTMLGSASEATSVLDQITQFAAKTPFNKNELIGYAKGMVGVGFAVKDIIPTMEMLGNIAAGVGQEKLPNIVKAFDKMKAKGKASLEELWPIVEAGVPILDQLAKDLGKSKDQVIKMATAGTLSFDQVNKSLKKVELEKFNGLMDELSTTFGGKMSNLNDQLDMTAVIIGNKIMPAASVWLDLVSNILTEINSSGGESNIVWDSISDAMANTLFPLKPLLDGSTELAKKANEYLFATSQIPAKLGPITSIYEKQLGTVKQMVDQFNKAHPQEDKKPPAVGKAKTEAQIMQDNLNKMALSQEAYEQQRLNTMQSFYDQRMALQGEMTDADVEAWRQAETKKIEMSKLTQDQKLAAMIALDNAIKKNAASQLGVQIKYGQDMLSTTGSMLTDLQTVFKNAGKNARSLAIAMKVVQAAQSGINTYLAFTKALTLPFPLNWVQGSLVMAAGLAAQAAIISTPIPSAETGLTNYTVPDIRSNRNDGAAVMAQGGEEVSITPRGESSGGLTNINITVSEQTIFSIVAKGIKTGQIDLNNKNVGRGVFAN